LTELEGALAGDDLSRIEGAVLRLREGLAACGPEALRSAGKEAAVEMDRRLGVVEGLLLLKLVDDGPAAETYTIGRLRKYER
jgi:hypothetical protein